MACSLLLPHISAVAANSEQTVGRVGWPKIWHNPCSESCIQRTPAGLPLGIPGIGEEIEGAMQQAAQPIRQSIG